MKSKFFAIAKKLSLKSTSKFKLGCVIVSKSRIVSLGWNSTTKTHPKAKTEFNFLHAEIHALIGTPFYLTKNSTAYIYRENKNGDIAKSRPCTICLEALRIAGVKRICYTDETGFLEEKI